MRFISKVTNLATENQYYDRTQSVLVISAVAGALIADTGGVFAVIGPVIAFAAVIAAMAVYILRRTLRDATRPTAQSEDYTSAPSPSAPSPTLTAYEMHTSEAVARRSQTVFAARRTQEYEEVTRAFEEALWRLKLTSEHSHAASWTAKLEKSDVTVTQRTPIVWTRAVHAHKDESLDDAEPAERGDEIPFPAISDLKGKQTKGSKRVH